jgi:hypothetical protein
MHISFINVTKYMFRHFGGLEVKGWNQENNTSERRATPPSYCMSDAALESLRVDMTKLSRTTPGSLGAAIPFVFEPKGTMNAKHWQI